MHRALQQRQVGGPTALVDIEAVGPHGKLGDLGAKLAQHVACNVVCGSVPAIDGDPQAMQRRGRTVGALAELNVTAPGVDNAPSAAHRLRRHAGHGLVQRGFDGQFVGIRQLATIGAEQLDTVVVVRVMRCADHDADLGAEGAREISNCRCGHRADEQDIDARRGEAGFQCRFKEIPGQPRVFSDHDLAAARSVT